ncbi:MAG: patatin-like phospholipase family protein [Candidatus Marinimicrobia bacterium]|nr:patatin-like phospholipase family protein [Candidatus Neomarinimicrobiota bacterium]MCF7840209.1 patatin-like phospholipase family protein [Candidatus Neomarinimicrobiota bacterium]MCF7902385.1 patatin-like phospholipase family protein [Candidatus Neomarinimicrobiota bacterium]
MRAVIIFLISLTLLVGQERPKLGLALSGGGARGLAHIGVLMAFEEHHIPIDIIGGTSAGAIIGGLYAAGVSLEEFEEWEVNDLLERAMENRLNPYETSLEKRFQNLPSQFELYFNRDRFQRPTALMSDVGLSRLLTYGLAPGNFAANGDFDQLVIPFRAITADLVKQKVHVIDSGSLMESIRKSMAFPIIFEPIKEDSALYVDGGIYDNLPIDAIREAGADYIVAVNVATPAPQFSELNDLPSLAAYYMNIFAARSDSASVSGWDAFIDINLPNINLLDFYKSAEAIQAGYEAGLQAVEEIKREFPYESNPDLFHLKQEMMRNCLDDRVISEIRVSGNTLLTREQVLRMLPIDRGDTLRFFQDLDAIYSLLTNSFINTMSVSFLPDETGEGLILQIHLVENLKMRLTGGFYFDRSAGMNIYASFENRRIFRSAIYNQAILYLGNFHSGMSLSLSNPNMLRYELLKQQLGMQLVLGTHSYEYDSQFDGVNFLTHTVTELRLRALSLLSTAFQLSASASYRDFGYQIPGGVYFNDYQMGIPGWEQAGQTVIGRGSYGRYSLEMLIDESRTEFPVPEGLRTRVRLTGGITRPNLRNFQLLHTPLRDVIFHRLDAYGTVGGMLTNRFGAAFSLELNRMLGDALQAPLPEWVQPWEGALQKYSLGKTMLMHDQITMITDLLYNPGIRNLWIHLNFFQAIGNHFNFSDITTLQPRDNVGIELSFEYDTPIGPLLYGFSWVEKSGWTGQSYARIGWKF